MGAACRSTGRGALGDLLQRIRKLFQCFAARLTPLVERGCPFLAGVRQPRVERGKIAGLHLDGLKPFGFQLVGDAFLYTDVRIGVAALFPELQDARLLRL